MNVDSHSSPSSEIEIESCNPVLYDKMIVSCTNDTSPGETTTISLPASINPLSSAMPLANQSCDHSYFHSTTTNTESKTSDTTLLYDQMVSGLEYDPEEILCLDIFDNNNSIEAANQNLFHDSDSQTSSPTSNSVADIDEDSESEKFLSPLSTASSTMSSEERMPNSDSVVLHFNRGLESSTNQNTRLLSTSSLAHKMCNSYNSQICSTRTISINSRFSSVSNIPQPITPPNSSSDSESVNSSPMHSRITKRLRSPLPLSYYISDQSNQQIGPLQLTDEENRTLIAEGYCIPSQLPLSKSEEKTLKKIRRKIKNKISAQESRRKKKEYVDTLEKRVKIYNKENHTLLTQIENLENTNKSLTNQLQHLQSMLSKFTSKKNCDFYGVVSSKSHNNHLNLSLKAFSTVS